LMIRSPSFWGRVSETFILPKGDKGIILREKGEWRGSSLMFGC
jgi:hypothetical protein